jgi:hypothetical protein
MKGYIKSKQMEQKYQPDIIGMRERVIINEIPRPWYRLSEEILNYYKIHVRELFEERNNIVHKGQEYRFKNE